MRRVVLGFHDVAPVSERDSTGFRGGGPDHYKVTPERFEQHLDAAAGHGHVVLTFDDGGASALSTVAPALERRGLRGVFFVPTAHVEAPGFLDGDGIRELHARGHSIAGPAYERLRTAALAR